MIVRANKLLMWTGKPAGTVVLKSAIALRGLCYIEKVDQAAEG